MPIKVSASILSADFAQLGSEVEKATKAGADYIHVDVMDGCFVPNITIGPVVISSMRRYTDLPFDVHLMIDSPSRYIKEFAESGADMITVHIESETHIERTISHIKSMGKKAGVSIVPTTHPYALEYIIHEVDLVLVMSVNPGFGGQSFIASQIQKICHISNMIKRYESNAKISVDGGLDLKNAKECIKAGAEILVAGSFIFKSENMKNQIEQLKSLSIGTSI